MPRKNTVRATMAVVPTIASARDLGVQFAQHQARGVHFVKRALEINPDLANDGAKAKTDENLAFWKEVDLGFLSYWDQTREFYTVCGEDATYTVAETGEAGDRITAGRAMEGVEEAESPTLHNILKAKRGEIQTFLRDKRRDLRDGVKRYLNQGKATQRGANKEFLVWMADEIKKIETKCKTEANKGEDADMILGIRTWLKSLDGHLGA